MRARKMPGDLEALADARHMRARKIEGRAPGQGRNT